MMFQTSRRIALILVAFVVVAAAGCGAGTDESRSTVSSSISGLVDGGTMVRGDDDRWCIQRPRIADASSSGISAGFVRSISEEYNEPVLIDVASATPSDDPLLDDWDYELGDGSMVKLQNFSPFALSGFSEVIGARYEPDHIINVFFVPGPDNTWQFVTYCWNDKFHTSVTGALETAGLPTDASAHNAALLELLLPAAVERAQQRFTGQQLAALKAQIPEVAEPPGANPEAVSRRPDWNSLAPSERHLLDMPQELVNELEIVFLDLSAIDFDESLRGESLCFSTPTAQGTCFSVGESDLSLVAAHRLGAEPVFLDWDQWSATEASLKGPKRFLTIPSSIDDGQFAVVERGPDATVSVAPANWDA